jgi:hypothetical protein
MRNNTQSGAALIALLAIFMLSATGILLYRLNNRTDFMLKNQAQTARALAKAKEALIGYAATYAETHPGQPQGYLPCPDYNGNGSASTCGTTGHSVIGRFPWRTLGLPPLRDGSGECLWYAVYGSYKNNPKQTLTSDEDGLFTVEYSAGNTIAGKGNTDEEKSYHRAIAIVFAPGRIIDGQDRSVTGNSPCGENAQADNYLDELNGINNATGGGTLIDDPSISATFIQAPITRDGNITNVTFNDVLMLITPKDFEPVYRRMDYWVAERVRRCLNNYAAENPILDSDGEPILDSDGEEIGYYPWASKLDSSDYGSDNGERFGRIPGTPLFNWTTEDDDWTGPIPCGQPICFNESQSTDPLKCTPPDNIIKRDKKGYWWWWDEWKEMVFFAVDNRHCPTCSLSSTSILTLSGEPPNPKEMIVLVAGRRLDLEERDETKLKDYLEGKNNDGDTGDEEFEKGSATSIFNDVVLGTP